MTRLATALVTLSLILSASTLLAQGLAPGGNNNPHNRAFYVNRPQAAAPAAAPSAGYVIGVPNYGSYGYQIYSYPSYGYGYRNYGYTSRGRYIPSYSNYGYGYGGPVITDARAFGFANPF